MGTPMPPHHRWTIAAFVLALVAAFAGGVWSMTLSPLEKRAATTTAAAPLPVEQVAAAAPRDLRLGATVAGDGSVVGRAAGSTWAVGRGTLAKIVSGTATVLARGPWSGHAILAPANDGSIWLASGRSLWPVSPFGTVGTRLTPSVGPISAVLAADGRTWVAGTTGTLAWIDPWTGNAIQSYYLGRSSYQLAAASDYVFVSTTDPTQPPIVRLDPALGEAVPVPGAAAGPIATADGRLWWGAADGIRCVVADTLRRCGRIDVASPAIMAGQGRALWVVFPGAHGAELALFDAKNGRSVAGPIVLPGSAVTSVEPSAAAAWVGIRDTGTVVQVARR
jgi:hypothetical protein